MRMNKKNLVYQYIENSESGVTAIQISQALNLNIRVVNGLLIKLRVDGKLVKTRGPNAKNVWRLNGCYYLNEQPKKL